MLRKFMLAMVCISPILFQGCAPIEETDRLTNLLTQGNIQQALKIGQTTRQQILDAFGAPNIIATNAEGNEVWNYQRSSAESKARSSAVGWLLPLVIRGQRQAANENSSRMLTLVIEFNSNNIVSDFHSRSSDF